MSAVNHRNPKVVFYCDDDEDDLLMFRDSIKEIDQSIQCITSSRSEQAIENLSKGIIRPDIIFLDINMPKINGIEMLARLKKLGSLEDVPIVMYTTSTYRHELDQCFKLGADLILTKPFNPSDAVLQLRETIGTYFG